MIDGSGRTLGDRREAGFREMQAAFDTELPPPAFRLVRRRGERWNDLPVWKRLIVIALLAIALPVLLVGCLVFAEGLFRFGLTLL